MSPRGPVLVCLLAGLAALAPSPARADLAAGQAAFDAHDYAAAGPALAPLAAQGEAVAQRLLGQMYAHGWGVARNDTTAWGWYRRAAERGDAEAALKLADAYDAGLGVPLNYKEALAWYTKAAGAGAVHAKAQLGLYNLKGRGKKPDMQAALRWLTEAAGAGDSDALVTLDQLCRRRTAPDAAACDPGPVSPPGRPL